MTDLDSRLAKLSPGDQQLIQESGPVEDVFPLSVFQQGMWFLEQLRPGNPAYVVPNALRIRGQLRTDVMVAALNEIVRRHEALRTTFHLRDGNPVQVVRPPMAVSMPEIDLSDSGLDDRELEQRIVAEALGEPMRIDTGPLLRLKLLRTGADESVLVLALHHLISDRWSIGILMLEFAALYEALSHDRPSPLAEPAIQYGDFATWQQQQLEQDRWAADLEHWRQHLAGAPAALELPTDWPRPAVQGFTGDFVPVQIPEPLMRELGALARQHGATTYMALLTIFKILLRRYSNQDDIVVGVPTAMRGRPEIESLIGYFVNTLPIRTKIAGKHGFAQLLAQVREASLGAYQHQEVPFDVIVADLKPGRDLSRPPIYQVSFSYGREPAPAFALGDTELTRIRVKSGGARFDLELQAFDDGGALSGWLEYDRDLFAESTITRMAGHFLRLTEQVVASPEQSVDLLDPLGDDEREQILIAFNDTRRDWPGRTAWIHQRFEEQARLRPDAPAVRFEGADRSYAELNRRANQLARRLVRLGVGRDVLVGIGMERSPDLVVALLAVLKAGGAYAPMDPGYPRARLEHMIETAGVPVMLAQRRVWDGLPTGGAEVLYVDEIGSELDGEPDGDLDLPVGGEDLAYVIFTSGSTGAPKGVMNVHAGIRNRLLWMQDAYGLDPTDRVLQKTPFSFDVSVWEFFWPLMTGATLVVARPEGHKDSAYLARLIQDESVTTVHFVPSMLQIFLTEPVGECASLRRVICSGEALPRDLQDRFLARSGAELHNLYGPTEAAVDVTSWACRGDGAGPVPIGMPIANTQIYVLDRLLRPVPVGVAGELHIGGRNLARGYLNRPRLTAERFIADPYGPVPGARMYRTGDLARFRDDGSVEFLGRLDYQVKLRGFRIELGEIEAALTGHERVREAVVVAREHRPGGQRLTAYLTAADHAGTGAAGLISELIGQLRQQLPEYMVPAYFEVLDEFPLSANGKIDRGALPEPTGIRPDLDAQFVPPQDDLEDSVAALWREVLEVDRVGRHDSFFDLGGHSLLLARLRIALAERTGHEVSMVKLFQRPTVASLADYLRHPPESPGDSQREARERAENRRRSLSQRRAAIARPGTGKGR